MDPLVRNFFGGSDHLVFEANSQFDEIMRQWRWLAEKERVGVRKE